MALIKKVTMPNGLPLGYHRVALVSIDVNNQNTVLVHSYLDEAARRYEKDYAAGLVEGEPSFPYVEATYYNPEYSGAMSVAAAYAWLRALPEFEGAEDDSGRAGEVTGDELLAMIEEVM